MTPFLVIIMWIILWTMSTVPPEIYLCLPWPLHPFSVVFHSKNIRFNKRPCNHNSGTPSAYYENLGCGEAPYRAHKRSSRGMSQRSSQTKGKTYRSQQENWYSCSHHASSQKSHRHPCHSTVGNGGSGVHYGPTSDSGHYPSPTVVDMMVIMMHRQQWWLPSRWFIWRGSESSPSSEPVRRWIQDWQGQCAL